jgi:type IV secretory pathway VirB2 component (pilin)
MKCKERLTLWFDICVVVGVAAVFFSAFNNNRFVSAVSE